MESAGLARSDAQLVASAAAGDRAAFGALYERHFDAVYDFLARMVRNREEAADLAQDTFIRAMNALGNLEKGGSVRSWLFTIARNAALNRIERQKRVQPLARGRDADGEELEFDVVDTDRLGDPALAAEATAAGTLVWDAALGLDPKHRSVLDLHLRQGLGSSEIAGVLGISDAHGAVVLNRMKAALEASVGALVLLRDGRRSCVELDSLLERERATALTPEVRRLIEKHSARCPRCQERRRRLVAPLVAFGALAPVGAPAGLKEQIASAIEARWANAAQTSAAGPAARRGAPKPRTVAMAVMAAGVGVVALLGAFTFARGGDDPATPVPAGVVDATPTGPATTDATPTPIVTSPTASPSPTALAASGATETQTATDTSTATAVPTQAVEVTATPTSPAAQAPPTTATPAAAAPPTGTPTPTSTAIATPTLTATATATPTPTPTPCPPSLGVRGGVVDLGQASNGAVQVTNTSCSAYPVASSVTAGANWLSVGPASTNLGPGETAAFALSVDRNALDEGRSQGSVRFSAGGATTDVAVQAMLTGAPPVLGAISKTCGSGGMLLIVPASDDYGVVSVVASWSAPSAGQVVLSGPNGSTSGTWTGTANIQTFSVPVTVTTTDRAGQTASQVVTC